MEAANNYRASVILTTYNSEHCIPSTLESLLAQTMTDFELIVVDDASTDNTAEILKSFSDPRLKLVLNDHNMGVSAARNKGIALATGEYIFPSDHDDISKPERFIDQISYLEGNPSVLMVASQVDFFLRGGRYLNHRHDCFSPHLLRWMLFLRSPIVHSSICFRRESWVSHGLQYNPAIKYADDYELYHRFADLGEIHMVPKVLLTKNESGDNASYAKQGEMRNSLETLLLDRYRKLLGCTMEGSTIDLVMRLCNEGKVARSREEVVQIGEFIERFTKQVCERYSMNDNEKADVYAAACGEWWRIVSHFAKANAKPGALTVYNQLEFYRSHPRLLKSWVREFVLASLRLKKEKRH